ncbi:MAG: 30S ribosomal protein S6 [Acidimicrobiales bacterium]|nr:30S ribosomal protein S6 [Acidimicrobiales bacterium]
MNTRAYEIMIIVDGDEEDTKVDDVIQNVDTWVQDQSGQIVKNDKWGKRKFAYEINHKAEGHYVVLEMITGQIDMEPLERLLRLTDEVVRHKLIRLPEQEAIRRGLLEKT